MISLSPVVLAGALLVAASPGSPSTAPAIGVEVVLAVVDTKEDAHRLMQRAAWLLDYPVAFDTVFTPPRQRHALGRCLAARRGARGRLVVSVFLGEPGEERSVLGEVRRYFRSAWVVGARLPPDADVSSPFFEGRESPYRAAGLLVVGSSSSYAVAARDAERFSAASGIPYITGGMVFDEKRGLIVPDDDEDEMYAGRYISRRYDGCNDKPCVTVERSEAYPGLSPKLYIVVAGIVEQRVDGDERLRETRRYAVDAFLKPTILYMGCRH